MTFNKGDVLGRGDLDVFLTNIAGNPSNANAITYAIYYVDPTSQQEILIGSPNRTAVNPQVGEYYASLMIPRSSTAGDYRIRWTFKELASSPFQQVVQEFAVLEDAQINASLGLYTDSEKVMIDKLRLLLRDQNPDKYYHFRPPEHEGDIGSYNRVMGFVWEDAELYEYLERGLDWWNMHPPETESLKNLDILLQRKPAWRTAVLWCAIIHATFALQANWTVDEFDYSIGGISLNIERSSKYEMLRAAAETQVQMATEMKQRTTKYIRGLQQPKYGIGIRSAFGPNVGRGVLSPRGFIG